MSKFTIALLPVAAVLAVVLLVGGGLRTAHAQGDCLLVIGEDFSELCISLDPETASNPVGTEHTVTATVTEDGAPAEGWPVAIFVIDGPNGPDEDGFLIVQDMTNDSGQVALTYTGDAGPGTDIILACIDDIELDECAIIETDLPLIAQATKEWFEPGPAPSFDCNGELCIGVEPEFATNDVDTDHTVTATLTNDGVPAEGTLAFFAVTDGPNAGTQGACSPTADCATDANGQVYFTYTGDGGVGLDTIQACRKTLCVEATKTWEEPTPTSTPEPTVLAATATPAPTVAAAVQLPTTGGTPSDGGSGALTWLAAIAGAIALIGSGSAWFAYQRRRVR